MWGLEVAPRSRGERTSGKRGAPLSEPAAGFHGHGPTPHPARPLPRKVPGEPSVPQHWAQPLSCPCPLWAKPARMLPARPEGSD